MGEYERQTFNLTGRFPKWDTKYINHKRKKLINWTIIKFKNFYSSKDIIKRVKSEQKIFLIHTSNKGLIQRVPKQLLLIDPYWLHASKQTQLITIITHKRMVIETTCPTKHSSFPQELPSTERWLATRGGESSKACCHHRSTWHGSTCAQLPLEDRGQHPQAKTGVHICKRKKKEAAAATYVTHKTWNSFYLVLYRQSLPTHDLGNKILLS